MPPNAQGAPWARTRLRTAPVSALVFGVLVLLTAFLAAVLPRAVERYGTEGLREAVAEASPESTVGCGSPPCAPAPRPRPRAISCWSTRRV